MVFNASFISRFHKRGFHILSLVIAIQQSRVYLLKMWKKMWKCTQVQIFGKEFNIIPTPTKRWLEYQSSSREGTNTNFLQNWWSATAHKGGADTCSLLPILFYTCWYFCCMVLSKLTLKKCCAEWKSHKLACFGIAIYSYILAHCCVEISWRSKLYRAKCEFHTVLSFE